MNIRQYIISKLNSILNIDTSNLVDDIYLHNSFEYVFEFISKLYYSIHNKGISIEPKVYFRLFIHVSDLPFLKEG